MSIVEHLNDDFVRTTSNLDKKHCFIRYILQNNTLYRKIMYLNYLLIIN